jgi:hypothetical protein
MKPKGQYGFRLDPSLAKELEKEAAKRGLSPGRFARLLVVDALSRPDESLSEELEELRGELQALKDNLTTAVVTILTNLGGGWSEEEVEKWAKENLG